MRIIPFLAQRNLVALHSCATFFKCVDTGREHRHHLLPIWMAFGKALKEKVRLGEAVKVSKALDLTLYCHSAADVCGGRMQRMYAAGVCSGCMQRMYAADVCSGYMRMYGMDVCSR